MSDLYTPTNVNFSLLTWTPLVHSPRYLGFESTPSSLKVMGAWVAHVILFSALGPITSLFLFLVTFIQLGGLLGYRLGLRHGPGLDDIDGNVPFRPHGFVGYTP